MILLFRGKMGGNENPTTSHSNYAVNRTAYFSTLDTILAGHLSSYMKASNRGQSTATIHRSRFDEAAIDLYGRKRAQKIWGGYEEAAQRDRTAQQRRDTALRIGNGVKGFVQTALPPVITALGGVAIFDYLRQRRQQQGTTNGQRLAAAYVQSMVVAGQQPDPNMVQQLLAL